MADPPSSSDPRNTIYKCVTLSKLHNTDEVLHEVSRDHPSRNCMKDRMASSAIPTSMLAFYIFMAPLTMGESAVSLVANSSRPVPRQLQGRWAPPAVLP